MRVRSTRTRRPDRDQPSEAHPGEAHPGEAHPGEAHVDRKHPSETHRTESHADRKDTSQAYMNRHYTSLGARGSGAVEGRFAPEAGSASAISAGNAPARPRIRAAAHAGPRRAVASRSAGLSLAASGLPDPTACGACGRARPQATEPAHPSPPLRRIQSPRRAPPGQRHQLTVARAAELAARRMARSRTGPDFR
jgi:hypothetical protein